MINKPLPSVHSILGGVSSPAKAPGPAASPKAARLDLVNTGDTAVIVTCHNYGRFLSQCLESLIDQTLPFAHIIVVDDASIDGTPHVCAQYQARGIRILRGDWHDFTAARQAGLAALPPARFLLFVDADNWISPNFHAELRKCMDDPSVGVAYAAIRSVNEYGRDLQQVNATPFGYAALRRENYADACSLIRREAYDQAGGWEAMDGVTDWLLWLKITRLGWGMKLASKAALYYRRHAANMSRARKEQGRDRAAKIDLYRRGMLVTIVTLFSGRTWMIDRYVATLKRLAWNHANLRLVAIDNSRDPEFSLLLREALATTRLPFTLIRDDTEALAGMPAAEFADDAAARSAHTYALSAHLARLYARAREEMPSGTDLVWCLEDDIEPPSDVLEEFSAGLYANQKAGAISACVPNRFADALIAWQGRWSDYAASEACQAIPLSHLTSRLSRAPFPRILCSGLMCTLFRRAAWDAIAFRPSPLWHDTRRAWYDWAVGRELDRLGYQWLLASGVHCRHWQAPGEPLTSNLSPLTSPYPPYAPCYPLTA